MDYAKYYDEDYFKGGTKSNYIDYARNKENMGRALQLVARHHPKTALDIGCAYGYTVESMRELEVDCYGCDVSEYAISRSPIPQFTFVSSIFDIPLGRHYDLVFSTDVLEHIEPERMEEAVAIMAKLGTVQDHAVSCWPGKTEHEHLSIHPIEWWIENVPGANLSDYEGYLKLAVDHENTP